MVKMVFDDSGRRYAALRMIEMLFIQGKISEAVYRRAIMENADPTEIISFTGFFVEEKRGGSCTKLTD